MRLLRTVVLSLLLSVSARAADDSALRVPLASDQVSGLQELGSVQVSGLGEVRMTARRDGTQLVLTAVGPDDKVVGRAESVIGVQETLIYLMTLKGLRKVTVLWKGL